MRGTHILITKTICCTGFTLCTSTVARPVYNTSD